MGSVQRLATVVIVGLVALSTILFLYLGDEDNRINAKEEEHLENTINRATENWTALPANWQEQRALWEYSHAVRAILYVLALGALVMSLLDWRPVQA